MSWQRSALNRWLRLVEKPRLAHATSHDSLRNRLERNARFFFRGPRDVLQHWRDLGDGAALWLEPAAADRSRVLLYFHGGAYIFGSPRTHAAMVGVLAKAAGVRAVLPAYPLAPEHPFPAAVDRAEDAYHALVAAGVSPENIVLGGDSAGGGLVLAVLGRLIGAGADLPAGVFALSPLTEMAAQYLAGAAADDPQVSPLFADFTGAPPVWLTVGDTEILLDDTRRIAAHVRTQGVSVQMHIAGDLPHVWPMFHNTLPEARATLGELAGWIRSRWVAAPGS